MMRTDHARAAPTKGCETAGDVVFVRADAVRPRKLQWEWYGRLAKGMLTLWEGTPDKGKSTALADITARVTKGRPMPGEERTSRKPGNVVMLIAEDDLEITVVPRLIAAGADLS